MSKILNRNLNRARLEKPDEYYTQLVDIENELKYYSNHFKNKIVYCNCDDPRISKFFHFFSFKFEVLGLKELISVCYKNSNPDLFNKSKFPFIEKGSRTPLRLLLLLIISSGEKPCSILKSQ